MMILQYCMASLGASKMMDRQRGATLIEYVLIVAVIAIAVFLGAQFGLASAITGVFGKATSAINASPGT